MQFGQTHVQICRVILYTEARIWRLLAPELWSSFSFTHEGVSKSLLVNSNPP